MGPFNFRERERGFRRKASNSFVGRLGEVGWQSGPVVGTVLQIPAVVETHRLNLVISKSYGLPMSEEPQATIILEYEEDLQGACVIICAKEGNPGIAYVAHVAHVAR